jgi:hypothetical protein
MALMNETEQAADNSDMIDDYYTDMYGPFMKTLNYDYKFFPYSC